MSVPNVKSVLLDSRILLSMVQLALNITVRKFIHLLPFERYLIVTTRMGSSCFLCNTGESEILKNNILNRPSYLHILLQSLQTSFDLYLQIYLLPNAKTCFSNF